MLGVEVAGSSYYGNQSATSYNPLSITAIDWTLQRGPFELLGEAAWAYSQKTPERSRQYHYGGNRPFATDRHELLACPESIRLNPLGPPQRMQGFYIQGNYHFMPAFLTKLSPKRFGEGSTFTAVVRYDRVNLNRGQPRRESG